MVYKPDSVRQKNLRGSHSSEPSVARGLMQPTRMTDLETDPHKQACTMPSLFGFAPGGVYHAEPVASSAVRSYRTLSPLPR